MGTVYNLKSPGIKRLMREAAELADPTEDYSANPLEDNLFEWHFTVRGPPNTEFEGGIYHGRIILPTDYPMKPPDIILLTPNGRFEINKKICLSISGHHPETWQPSWSIRTALVALIAFMPTATIGAIGSLNYSPEERQALAKKSRNWECDICGKVSEKLFDPTKKSSKTQLSSGTESCAEPTPCTDTQSETIEPVENPVSDNQINETIPLINTESDRNVFREEYLAPAIFIIIASIVVLIFRRMYGFSYNNTTAATE